MKRAITNQFDQLVEKLTSYVAMLNFRYLNLCIKAEEASLIPVRVHIEGTDKNLEQVAYTAKKDEYRFWIVPKYEEDLPQICEGVARVHPEFKQKIDTVKVDGFDDEFSPAERDVTILQLTMPEVNDDRHDILKDAADLFYEECKVKMEAAVAKASAEMAVLAVGESEEDIEAMEDTVKKIDGKLKEQRDKLHDDKLKEIEEAYQAWINKVK